MCFNPFFFSVPRTSARDLPRPTRIEWGAFAWDRAGRPQMDRAHVTVTLGYPDRRKRDAHNLMATVKPLLDGMVSPGVRGILLDDDDAHLEGPDLRVGDVTPGFFTFTFRFEELPDE